MRRVWAPKGKTLRAKNNRKFEWVYAYCFVRPKDGKTYWLLLPTVSVQAVNEALKAFAKGVNPDGNKVILILWDQAGFHKGKEMQVPNGIQFFPLPPYTPELQPVERVWPLLRQAIANKVFESLSVLQQTLLDRIYWLINNLSVIRSATSFHWLPDTQINTN